MNLQRVIAPLCTGSVLLLALYIWWRYSSQRIHRIFAFQIIGVAGYVLCLFGLAQAPTQAVAAQWMRYGMVLPYLLIFTWYWFCVVFSRNEHLTWTRWLPWIVGVPALLDIVGRLLGWYALPPMELRPGQGWFPASEWPYLYLYMPSLFVLFGGGLGLLLWRLRKPWSSLERQNLLIMLASMGISLGFALTCFLPKFSVLMPLAPLTYVSVITYGLSRRRLLNLSLLVREGAVAALGSLLLTATVALTILAGMRILNATPGIGILFCAAALFAVLYPLQQRFSRFLLGRWLGKELNLRQVLLDYSLLASSHPALEGLIRATLEQLVQEHGLTQAGLFLPDRGGKLSLFAVYPMQELAELVVGADGEVARTMQASPQGLDVDSLGWTWRYEKNPPKESGDEAVSDLLQRTRMQACFGMTLRGRLRGILMVGAPTSGRGLQAYELDFFAALAAQLAGMLENASLEGQVQHADRLSTLGMLAASVAHEIRNSLASINVFLAMFDKRHSDPAFMEKFNRVVGTEMEKLTRLSDDMMNLSRPATQVQGVVDLGMLCERERMLVEHSFRKAQVKLVVESPTSVLVFGEETRLSQVLLNLLLNALEVSPEGSTVRMDLLCRQSEAELRVRDHGPGIKPEVMGMMFEPFFTTKEHGHGLGLATSRRIVESFGGQMAAANVSGGGAEFTVRLPLPKENRKRFAA